MPSRSSPSESSLISNVHGVRLDLGEVEDVVEQLAAVRMPEERITLAYSTCASVRLPSGLSSSCSARTSRLLSGVRSSCDMFAMNSDLYFDEIASCSAFSSTSRFASSTSWFLRSTSVFFSASSAACRRGPRWIRASSSCRDCSSCACDCDCSSSVLGERVGLDRVEHEPDALGELIQERLVGRAERRERRQLDHGAHRALEQDRQHDDVERRRLAETGVDPDVVAGHVGEQDPLLLQRALADEALAETEVVREVLALLVAVSGLVPSTGSPPSSRWPACRRRRAEPTPAARAPTGSCSTPSPGRADPAACG